MKWKVRVTMRPPASCPATNVMPLSNGKATEVHKILADVVLILSYLSMVRVPSARNNRLDRQRRNAGMLPRTSLGIE